jgi:hypothetical protein
MKKQFTNLVMAVAVILIAVNANAQLGVRVGFVTSKPTIKVSGGGATIKPDTKAFNGFKVGADYNIPVAGFGLSVRPGLNYIFLGGRDMQDPGDSDSSNNFHFLNIPVDVKYQYSFNDDLGLYAVAGPRVVVGLAAFSKWEEDGGKASYNLYTGSWKETNGGETESGKDEDEAYLNRFDLQMGLGIGAQYRAFSLELGYDFGMLNMVKKKHAEIGGTKRRISRGQFGVTLGMTF